jgi:predicted amidohydrolase YtcJ
MTGRPTIYRARRFVTLDSSMPHAEAVAVADGKVLHSGSFADVSADLTGRDPLVDDSFIDHVVVPGFIEAHCHALKEGALVNFPWVGTYDRKAADGSVKPGCPDTAAVLERMRESHASTPDDGSVLTFLGWDPNMANSTGLTCEMLDSISADRPIFVLQSNGHLGHCNSAMMRRAGITRDTTDHGVMRHGNGEPTGELRELSLSLVLGKHVKLEPGGDTSVRNAGTLARMSGCTTVTDLAFSATTSAVTRYAAAVNQPGHPVRVVYAPMVQVLNPRLKEGTLEHIRGLAAHDSEMFRMGPVKFVIDGSIQGRSARLKWPGYCCGDPNGMWLAEPDEMFEMMRPYHREGFQLALHTNGDEAVDRGLDVYERLLLDHPRFDHRHRLEHAQMATESAFRRMKSLGVCVNLFANHVYYWGDTHRTATAGPAKARRLDACGTAEQLGVPYSIHCDAPVTPLDPLFTMWCAVNRITSSGHLLGASERITAEQALRAMTISAAYLLRTDGISGSIEVGKHADFAVLADDPTTCDPMAIKDIRVAATVLGGEIHAN